MTTIKMSAAAALIAISSICSSISAAQNNVESRLADLVDKLISTAQFSGKTTIAVIPFANNIARNTGAGVGVAEYLITLLQSNPSVQLIERTELKKAMEEQALSLSGAIPEEKALSIGKMVAARYLLTGTMTDALGKSMVNARLIEIETGKIVASATAGLDADLLTSFSKEILGEKTQISATIFRSALVPGWGQFYTNHPVHGGTMLAGFLAGAGATVWSFAVASQKANTYNDFKSGIHNLDYEQQLVEEWFGPGMTRDSPQFDQARFNLLIQQRETEYWNTYQSWLKNGILWTAITGGVWAINLLDAAILGNKTKNKVNLYFSAGPQSAHASLVFNY